MTAAASTSSSAAALIKLDGYMAATGYEDDHPWRLEIGAALNTPSANVSADEKIAASKPRFVFTGTHCLVEILPLEADDRINLLSGQLAAILRVMSSDGYDPHIAHIIQMLAKKAVELAEKVRDGVDGSALVADIRELLYMIQDEKRTDHVHSLCQQITDELDFIFSTRHEGENQQISDP